MASFLYFTGNNFAVGTVCFLSKGGKFCDDVKKFNMKKSKKITQYQNIQHSFYCMHFVIDTQKA